MLSRCKKIWITFKESTTKILAAKTRKVLNKLGKEQLICNTQMLSTL
jgi:hypothetical protein